VQIPHYSGDELCHYVDLRDVARMFLVAGEHPRAAGEIFNCVGPGPTRGWEFVRIVQAIVPGIQVDFGFPWSMAQGGEISFSMGKAKEMLDFLWRASFLTRPCPRGTIECGCNWFPSGTFYARR
jgi:nucleoside-diphosphate-sugar epimerase